MASNRTKLIQLTDYTGGAVFMLSSNQIVSFTAIATSDTSITYVNQRGKLIKRRVLETVSAIDTACISNGIHMMIPITLSGGIILYLNIDRVIYVDVLANSSPLVTSVTYDAGVNSPAVYKCSLPTAANFAAATDNIFAITTQPNGAVPSKTRYINTEKIDVCAQESVVSLPSISFTTKAKIGTGIITNNGTSGITSATVTFTGGGASVQATGHLTVAAGVITAFTIDTAGSGYTSYPTITVNVTGGSAGTTPTVTCSFLVESPMTIVDAGSNLNTAPTLTFSATTGTLATATTTLNANTQKISGTTLTNAGAYKNGTDAYPTLSVSGGAGANIKYDEHKTEFIILQVEETITQLQTAVNAL